MIYFLDVSHHSNISISGVRSFQSGSGTSDASEICCSVRENVVSGNYFIKYAINRLLPTLLNILIYWVPATVQLSRRFSKEISRSISVDTN